jgi:peptide/nickel transport system substrate-binding protein
MERSNYWLKRRLSRRGFVAGSTTAVAGAAALAAVGCGDDDDDDVEPTSAPTSGGTQPTAAGGSPTAAAKPAPSGTLRASVASLMDQSADPFYQTGGLATPISYHLFNSFFRADDNGQRELDLAESFELAQDRMSIVFKMRKDVKFWDGTPATAKDMLWSYKAFIARTPPNPFVATLNNSVVGVEAPDESTILIKLKAPTAFQGQELIFWYISSEAYYNKVGDDAFKQNGMGTGPFKLAKNEKGQFTEFEAFPDHYRKDRVPYVKTVRLNIVPELTTRLAQIKANEIELTEGVTGATAQQLKNEKGIKILTLEETAQLKYAFVEIGDKSKAPWNDIRFREALVISVNQQEIADGLLRQGKPSPNVQIWPKMKGYDAKLYPARKYDPDRAKKLIQEAGLTGTKFNVYTYTSSSYPLIPEVTQACVGFWKAIGLEPTISQQEAGGYFTQFTTRKLDGIAFISFPFQPDMRLLAFNYMRTGAGYGSTDNFKEIDDGIAAMVKAESEEEQIKIVRDIYTFAYNNFLMGTAPWSDSQWASTEKVKDWKHTAGLPYMTRLESLQLNA